MNLFVKPDIALFLPNLAGGGAEIFMISLVNQFAKDGFTVDLLLANGESFPAKVLDSRIRTINLHKAGVLSSLVPLIRYLRKERPAVLMSTLVHANVIAILASVAVRSHVRIYVREATTPSVDSKFNQGIKSHVVTGLRRWLYPLATGVIANSQGVSEDLIKYSKLERNKVFVITNGLNVNRVLEKSAEPVDHHFFNSQTVPVIIGVGRLGVEKDYKTLILAFQKVLLNREVRLLIVGEGVLRCELEDLIHELGLEDRADLPGFVDNPYKYVARSAVFVLSSLYEGFPNVLLEAMVVGTQVVAMDCPSGPREILVDGRYGALVRIGDVDAMAQAIMAALDNKLAKPSLTDLRAQYGIAHIARRYEKALGLTNSIHALK